MFRLDLSLFLKVLSCDWLFILRFLFAVSVVQVVPIRGVEDMFKKSSVIVTRLIQIDMEATEERQRLYKRIMRGSNQQVSKEGQKKGESEVRERE